MTTSRRSFLAAVATGSVAGVAGCLGSLGVGSSDPGPETVTNRDVPGTGAPGGSIPQFQGDPAHTGHLATTGPGGPVETYWRRTPSKYENSQPVVVGDRVYVTFGGALYCLHRSDGAIDWSADVGHDGASTPAVHDGTAYVTVWNGGENVDRGLAAVDADSGEVRWRRLTDADVTTSPTATTEGVFVGGGYETSTVAAFDHDGTERWTHDLHEYASTPTVAGETVYYGAGDDRVVAYDAGSGEERWTAETDGETTAAPTVRNGLVFEPTRGGTLYALETGDGSEAWTADLPGTARRSAAATGDRIVVATEEGLAAFDRDGDGTSPWTIPTVKAATAPVIADGTVYVGDGAVLRALALSNGEDRWTFETRERSYTDVMLRGIRSAPTVADGVAFVATQAGDVYALGEKGT